MPENESYGQDTFLSRLDLFIHQEYGSRSKFCNALQIPASTLSSYFSKKRARPTLDFFESLASVHPELDLCWLISGNRAGSKTYGLSGSSLVQEASANYASLNATLVELTEAIQNSGITKLTSAIENLSKMQD